MRIDAAAASLASLRRGAIPNYEGCVHEAGSVWRPLDGGQSQTLPIPPLFSPSVWRPLDGGQSQTEYELHRLCGEVWRPLDGGQSQTPRD